MSFRATLLAAAFSGGCYMNLGAGGGGDGATLHMTIGIAVPIGDRGNIHGGVSTAGSFGSGDKVGIANGPVALGAGANVLGNDRHALSVVGDVSFPPGGNWLLPDEKSRSIGRAYAGVGYTYTTRETDHTADYRAFERPSGSVTVAFGPEVFWAEDDRRVGACVDVSFFVRAWVIGKRLDEK